MRYPLFQVARVAWLILVGTALGCASSPAPSSVPTPLPPSRDPERVPVSPPSPSGPLVFTYREGNYAYDVRQTTTVTVGADGGLSAEDTMITMAGLTYSISSTTGIPAVSVQIDSLTISSARDTTALPRRLSGPVMVTLPLTYSPMLTSLDSATISSSCDSMEEAARSLAADTYLSIPVSLEQGHEWNDSTVSGLCRGGIPLTATRASRYRIIEIRQTRDSTIARIARQTILSLGGSGLQGTRRITVRGDGSSEATLSYDVRGGRFLESTGQSLLQLTFETIQQTERVVQRSTSSVRLRPGQGAP